MIMLDNNDMRVMLAGMIVMIMMIFISCALSDKIREGQSNCTSITDFIAYYIALLISWIMFIVSAVGVIVPIIVFITYAVRLIR